MVDINKPITNPTLISAIQRMNQEKTRESHEAVLDELILNSKFLSPVTFTPSPTVDDSGNTVLKEDTQIQFQLLSNQEEQPFFPAFTDWEELRKLCGPVNQQTLVLTFDDYAGMVLRDNRAAGLVINPFGMALSFERPMLEHLVQRKEALGQEATAE